MEHVLRYVEGFVGLKFTSLAKGLGTKQPARAWGSFHLSRGSLVSLGGCLVLFDGVSSNALVTLFLSLIALRYW